MQKFLPLALILSLTSMKVTAQCDAAFSFTVDQGVVHFQAASTNNYLRHSWAFGDASYGTGASPTHIYSYRGAYTVTHILTDSLNQCSDTTEQVVGINIPAACEAHFIMLRDSVNYFLYRFQATPQLGNDIFYYWTIDDVLVPLPQPALTFSQVLTPGYHNICLAITSMAGCNSSACGDLTVFVPIPPPCTLVASFTTTAASANPKQISFFSNPPGDTLRFQWNFGDNITSVEENPVHTYAQAGTYSISLIITDSIRNCRDTVWQNVLVHGLPADSCTASFTQTIADSSHPNQISFAAVSNQTITSQTWWIDNWSDPYDSVFIHTNNPTYTFTDTGYYQICLYITTNTGCSAYHCNSINIDNIGGRVSNTIPSYPNPTSNRVTVRVKLTEATRIGITVYNLSGYAVYRMERQGNTGSNEITIPVEQLKRGQYFIDIKYGDQQKRSIFQKL